MTNLGDLEIYVKVVVTGSMSAAAKSLGLSPAVVSKRIKRLEEQLGTRLLQRTTRQIGLTDAGRGFYDRIANVLTGIEDAERFVSGESTEITGNLRISAPTSFGRMHIAPHLPTFMQAHPSLSIDLTLSDEFTNIIAEGYDVAIRISELKDSSLVARKLVQVRRILCAAPSYIERYGIPETMEELVTHHCLTAHNGEPWRLESPQGPLVYRPAGRLNTNSSEVIREAVIAGLGIALRSTWDIGTELKEGRLVRVLPQYEGSRNVAVSAVYPSREHLPSKVRVFIEYLADLYGPVPYWERSARD
ncbi:LysR family transcriptional regulator [Rhizobium terrae]|uniref:LysR family transcriptional regulator n=1 Tax=Rhizobium terrae TaxID=2171756 RepID=UPI000E3B7DC2|nr:LysR family transcriptional regulator [Rhizobium terrae]